MRKKLRTVGIIAVMLAAGIESTFKSGGLYEPEPEPIKPLPKGRMFIIEGIEIYALNERNARRKYHNLMNKQ